MKNINCDEFDSGPEGPNICTLPGYDSCEDCYFKLSTIERFIQDVRQIIEERKL